MKTEKDKKDDDENTLTKEEAKEMLLISDKGMVHTFYNITVGGVQILSGVYISKESVYKHIDESYLCKTTCKRTQKTGHGLAVIPNETCSQSDILFVKTKRVI